MQEWRGHNIACPRIELPCDCWRRGGHHPFSAVSQLGCGLFGLPTEHYAVRGLVKFGISRHRLIEGSSPPRCDRHQGVTRVSLQEVCRLSTAYQQRRLDDYR